MLAMAAIVCSMMNLTTNSTQAKAIAAKGYFINMTGPSSVSLSSFALVTYSSNVTTWPDDAQWVIMKDGVAVYRTPANPPSGGVATHDFFSSDFGTATGYATVFLVGTYDGYGLIVGSKSVNIIP